MARNVQISMVFNADTQQARQQIINLQNQLKQLTQIPSTEILGQKFQTEMLDAQKAVMQLGSALERSLNVDTGKLNLTKFQSELSRSGKSLTDYANQLRNLGPQGQQAFQNLAQSLMNANVQFRNSNKLISSMWTNLKNVAKWQISSAVLTSFTRAFSDAFTYAKDLNESLNNIRIVSGQSTEQMARFAKEANRAAKALSTTTTEYTDASLIFYQQGLEGQAVKDRADIVIKMANVTGNAAQEVSDQMTAVWNNFYDGSKSLEYYADVMTALGAATASSTDEIATGLEKFAATAETVGLSYEYATAALTTVTATTRQSADVVGTAFKTLFARIQDLELGETLDDGTTLGKYSEALDTVGVNIKDASGGLKDMDDILDETASKWKTLDRDAKTALAQTVAGTRQYTQFMALMDNWDFMEENLQTVNNATGELQNQQEVFEEGWEAASKRVKASFEGIYDSLINDEFIIDLMNGFAKFIGVIESVIDSMGGFKGVASGLFMILNKIFGTQMQQSIANMAQSLYSMTGAAKRDALNMQEAGYQMAISMIPKTGSPSNEMQAQVLKDQLALDKEIASLHKSQITPQLEAEVQAHKQILQLAGANVGELKEEEQHAKQVVQTYQEQIKLLEEKITKEGAKNNESFKDYDKILKETGLTDKQANLKGRETEEAYSKRIAQAYGIEEKQARYLYTAKKLLDKEGKKIIATRQKISGKTKELTEAEKKLAEASKNAAEGQKQYNNIVKNGLTTLEPTRFEKMAKSMMTAANTTAQLTMGLSSLSSIGDTLEDPNISGWQKLLQLLQSVSWAYMSLAPALTTVSTAIMSSNSVIAAQNALQLMNLSLKEHTIEATIREQFAEKTLGTSKLVSMTAEKLGITTKQAAIVISKMREGMTLKEALAETGLATAKSSGVISTGLLTIATWAQAAAQTALNITLTPVAAIITAIVLAITALVAIIWIAVASYKAYTNALNADSIAAEKATKASEELAETLNTTKEAYNSLLETGNKYKDAQKSLETLTKGTKKYQEALNVTNEEAIKLLNILPDLKYEFKEGQFYIQPEDIDKALEARQIQMNTVQNAQLMSQGYSKIKTNDQKLKNLKNKYSEQQIVYSFMSGSQSTYNKFTMEDLIKHYDNIQGKSTEELRNYFNNLDYVGTINDSSLKVIEQMIEGYESIIDEEEKASQSITMAQEAAATRIVNAITNEDNVQYSGGAAAAAKGAMDEERYEKNYETYLTNLEKAQVGTIKDTSTWMGGETQKGLELLYGESAKVQSVDADKDTITVEYVGSDGKLTTQDISFSTVASTLAQNFEDRNATSAANEALGYIDYFDKYNAVQGKEGKYYETEQGDSELINALYQGEEGLETLTPEQISRIQTMFNTGMINNNMGASLERSMGKETYGKLFGDEGLLEGYKKSYGERQNKANKEEAELYTSDDKTAEAVGMSEEAFSSYVDEISKGNAALEENRELARKVAKEQIDLSNKIKSAAKIYEDNKEALDENNRGTVEFAEACESMADGLNTIFDTNTFDADFVAANLDDVKAAMEGNVDAMARLQDAAAEDYLIDIGINTDEGLGQKINDWIGSQEFNDLEIGTSLDDSGMYEAFQAMLDSGQMTADQMNALLDTIGYEPQIDYVDIPMEQFVHDKNTDTYTATYEDPVTGEKVEKVITAEQYNESQGKGSVQLPIINKDKTIKVSTPKAMAKTALNSGGGSKGGGGGGSKSPEKKTLDKKSDTDPYKEEKNRYADINNLIEQNTYLREKNSKTNDHAVGLKRAKAIAEETASLKENNKLLKQRLDLAEKDLIIDANEAKKYFAFEFDEDGTILNEEAFTDWINAQEKARESAYDAGVEAYNAMTAEDQEALGEDYKENLDKQYEDAGKSIEDAKEAFEQYKETLGVVRDTESEMADIQMEILSNNMEEILAIYDTQLEVIEHSLDNIDARISTLSDDAQDLVKKLQINVEKSPLMIAEMQTTNDKIWDIQYKHSLGELNDDEAYEQLLEASTSLYDQIANINEYIEEMYHGLNDILDANAEELEKYTSYFENMVSAIDHYNTVMELTGKDKNYKLINEALRTQGTILKSNAEVSKENYLMLSEQMNIAKADLAAATTKEEKDAAQARIDDLAPALAEAYDTMLSDSETFAEKWQEILANAIEEAAEDMEKALTEGLGFDALSRQIDALQAKEEVFLTETNQVYETTKLIRTIQADIDSSTNKAHQAKLKAFQKETEQLKNQDKLSRDELEIQQLKYDLLVAEIALEEARDAKNKVRLMRDSQGNFNYVYTADQNVINDAQQKVDDANNALYNKYLDVTNTNAERIQQIQQEFAEEAAGLDPNDPNYLNDLNDLQARALEKIAMYQDQYAIGAEGLGNKIDEAWTTSIESSIKSTEDFKIATDKFISSATEAYNEYYDEVEWVADNANLDLNSMATTATNLKETVVKEVIPEMSSALSDGQIAIKAFAQQSAPHLSAMVDNFEAVANSAQDAAYAIAGLNKDSNLAQDMLNAKTEEDFWRIANYRKTKMTMYGMSEEEYGSNQDLFEQWKTGQKQNNQKEEQPKTEINNTPGLVDTVNKLEETNSTYDNNKNSEEIKREYTVKSGDNLSKIAKEVYGDASKWNELYEKNKNIIGNNPSKIYPGQILQYNTGGYTGKWGPEGRLAMLHEKELVLNKDDTANFLDALELTRSVLQAVDLNTLASQYSLTGKMAAATFADAFAPIQQDVHITAEFPNATDKEEIKAAFDDIINEAVQYAGIKRV